MRTRTHDLVLGAAFLLVFPAAIHLTDLASSEPGGPGDPARPDPSAAVVPQR